MDSKKLSSCGWVRPSRFTLPVVAIIGLTFAHSANACAHFGGSKEVGDFTGGRGFRVGTVNGVLVDGDREVGTDGARSRFLRVGGAHQLAVLGDGVLAFQNLNDDRTGSHEGNQILEEATLAVLGVETGSFALGQLNHLGSDDTQAGLLETGGDLADAVPGDSARLADGKGALQGHVGLQN